MCFIAASSMLTEHIEMKYMILISTFYALILSIIIAIQIIYGFLYCIFLLF